MMTFTNVSELEGYRHAHLSHIDPAWSSVAQKQKELDLMAEKALSMPIYEFRALGYRPPPLPEDAPLPDIDINITVDEILTNGGTKLGVRIYKPIRPPSSSALLFFNVHGGGWVLGSPETEEAQNRLIAAKNKAVVVSVDYRRAPESPYPAAINDSWDTLLWCRSNAKSLCINPNRIVVGGGSAGANICAVLAQKARDERVPGIIGQILNIPVTCHPAHFPVAKYEYESYVQNRDSPIVGAERMHWFWRQYLPNAEKDVYASPLLASSLQDLPPALVQVAGLDPLRDEGIAYADELKACGNATTLKIYPGMPHAFYVYPQLKPSVEYLQTMVDWLEQNFGQ